MELEQLINAIDQFVNAIQEVISTITNQVQEAFHILSETIQEALYGQIEKEQTKEHNRYNRIERLKRDGTRSQVLFRLQKTQKYKPKAWYYRRVY